MDFRALANRMDDAVFDTLADDATLDGRPVRGMFSAPWLAPQMGRLKTGLIEPKLALRDTDAAPAARDSRVSVRGFDYTVVSVEPDGSGVTTLILRPA